MRPFICHVVCTKSVLNPYALCSVHEMYHDLSMLVFCFHCHMFVDNFIYELQKSTTIAFSRNSLYTFYSRNPTCGIHQCLQISNRKYPPPPPPMPSEFHNHEPTSPSEILKAVRGMVWIFSGIAQCSLRIMQHILRCYPDTSKSVAVGSDRGFKGPVT